MGIDEMRRAVFQAKPTYGAFYASWGARTWIEYYRTVSGGLRTPSASVFEATARVVGDIFGDPREGAKAADALRALGWTSTADHHGLLNHPYFFAGNLARSHELVRGDVGATVTYAFGNISLGNDSFPRGFFFHDRDGRERRFLFKSLDERGLPMFLLSPMTREAFLRERARSEVIPLAAFARERLEHVLEAFAGDARIWSATSYGDQLTLMNAVLWRALFGTSRGELFYVPIDRVVEDLLFTKYLTGDTAIARVMTDDAWRRGYLTQFAGVQGAHASDHGTELFWYVDHGTKRRKRMQVRGKVLETCAGDARIPLERGSLCEAIRARRIIPATALLLLIVQAEEGLACAGGLSQLEYLPDMVARWHELHRAEGVAPPEEQEARIVAGDNTIFSLDGTPGSRALASLMDVYLYGDAPGAVVDSALARTSIADTIDAMVPTLHWLVTRLHTGGETALRIPGIPLARH